MSVDIVVQLRAHTLLVAEARELIMLPPAPAGRGLWDRAADEIERLNGERDALTARVAQLEACLTDVKEQQLELGGQK